MKKLSTSTMDVIALAQCLYCSLDGINGGYALNREKLGETLCYNEDAFEMSKHLYLYTDGGDEDEDGTGWCDFVYGFDFDSVEGFMKGGYTLNTCENDDGTIRMFPPIFEYLAEHIINSWNKHCN